MKLLLILITLLAMVGAASAGGYTDPLHAQGSNQAPGVIPMDASMRYTPPQGGYVAEQLAGNNFGLYYKVNQDAYHIGVSVEDDGYHEAAVERFLRFTMGTFWDYSNYVNPQFHGVFRVAGFENYYGEINEVFWYEVDAEDARYMSREFFIADGMKYYYEDPGYYTETYPTSSYTSYTSTSGSGVILVDTYADLYGPGDSEILITTEQDAADWLNPNEI